jgi:hypothetical protein
VTPKKQKAPKPRTYWAVEVENSEGHKHIFTENEMGDNLDSEEKAAWEAYEWNACEGFNARVVKVQVLPCKF